MFPWADTAVMVENAFLACACENLACIGRALFDRPTLAQALALAPDELVTFSQLVGCPAG